MSRKYLYPLLTVLIIAGLYYAEQYVDTQNEAYPETVEDTSESAYSEFDASFLPVSTTGALVTHSYFTLSYSEAHEQAEWVAYELARKHLSKNEFDRPDFVEDRKIASKSAHWRSYKNSGYDRGHLCPAGDRRFNFNAYHETFLTSNISPQNNDFNGGIWNKLEQKVRFWAKKYDGLFVVTGGVLKEGLPTIGGEGVSVPEAFYKIVLDASEGHYKAIAFLIPNEPTNNSYYDYVVTIDSIEAQTGIDFFPKLSENIEKQLEATIDLKAWGIR
ncbi:endonuclease G [Ulvibacter sp. MAR_2010_11]|uniref:DNA/RNA non-specific endonuclease n=1 Tax=Ulvibacter sp. MAR_2010_11 TaxID=1250229 RepID=UPI000C2C1A1C|nr:DNA/RNA non-specific endonuclease [Ulvibacter sp. MAR_2010_11]PKA82503.1 endonuclease G [Ulvibacter sp. MAR_2010_11]